MAYHPRTWHYYLRGRDCIAYCDGVDGVHVAGIWCRCLRVCLPGLLLPPFKVLRDWRYSWLGGQTVVGNSMTVALIGGM